MGFIDFYLDQHGHLFINFNLIIVKYYVEKVETPWVIVLENHNLP